MVIGPVLCAGVTAYKVCFFGRVWRIEWEIKADDVSGSAECKR